MTPAPEQLEDAKKISGKWCRPFQSPMAIAWIAAFLASRDAAKDQEIAELRQENACADADVKMLEAQVASHEYGEDLCRQRYEKAEAALVVERNAVYTMIEESKRLESALAEMTRERDEWRTKALVLGQ